MTMVSGQTIRKIRAIRGYTQEYVADKLNISQRTYSHLENDHTKIDVDRVKQLAEVFDVDPVYLVTADEKQVFNYGPQSGSSNLNNTITNFSGSDEKGYQKRIAELVEKNAGLMEKIGELMDEVEKLKKKG